jgi:hypothetical protein
LDGDGHPGEEAIPVSGETADREDDAAADPTETPAVPAAPGSERAEAVHLDMMVEMWIPAEALFCPGTFFSITSSSAMRLVSAIYIALGL